MRICLVSTAFVWLVHWFLIGTLDRLADYPPIESYWNLLNFIAFLGQWGTVGYVAIAGAGKILNEG